MSVLLELRDRTSHAGVRLVHSTSEHVVLATVFEVLKNLPHEIVFTSWVEQIVGRRPEATAWQFSFWERLGRPVGIVEGSTELDVLAESDLHDVSCEVKVEAEPAAGTRHDPNRDQLVRNLDVGHLRATRSGKAFSLIYITADLSVPEIVTRIRSRPHPFPLNPGIPWERIAVCLHWASWGSIGDVLAAAYSAGKLSACEQSFALDLMAYLAKKGLWQNKLADAPRFYTDKLYRSLRTSDSPFVPFVKRRNESYKAWRSKPWNEGELRDFLEQDLPDDGKHLLKLLAEAGGRLSQRALMAGLPSLQGKGSRSLGALKAHVNGLCRAKDRAPILSEGTGGSGDRRCHEINRSLGNLRPVVIEIAKSYAVQPNW